MSNRPVRLAKVEEPKGADMTKIIRMVEAAILRHPTLFLTLFMILAMLLFIVIIFTVCGASATESGLQYNQFQRII